MQSIEDGGGGEVVLVRSDTKINIPNKEKDEETFFSLVLGMLSEDWTECQPLIKRKKYSARQEETCKLIQSVCYAAASG